MSFSVRHVYGKYLTGDVLPCIFSVVAPALGKRKLISLLRHLIFFRRWFRVLERSLCLWS